jgi:hypothetical protein
MAAVDLRLSAVLKGTLDSLSERYDYFDRTNPYRIPCSRISGKLGNCPQNTWMGKTQDWYGVVCVFKGLRTPSFSDPESAVLPLDDVLRLNIAKITEERRRAQGRYRRTVPVRSHRVFVKKWVATEAVCSSHSLTVNSRE